jgi:hypothetical protein
MGCLAGASLCSALEAATAAATTTFTTATAPAAPDVVQVGNTTLQVREPFFGTGHPTTLDLRRDAVVVRPGNTSCQDKTLAADSSSNTGGGNSSSSGCVEVGRADISSLRALNISLNGGNGTKGEPSVLEGNGTGVGVGVGGPQPGDDPELNVTVLVVPGASSGERLRQLLAPYHATHQWLHFANVTATFRAFEDPGTAREFGQLLRRLVHDWCCRKHKLVVEEGQPNGHLHAIRPWGSQQRVCMREVRVKGGPPVHSSYFCNSPHDYDVVQPQN